MAGYDRFAPKDDVDGIGGRGRGKDVWVERPLNGRRIVSPRRLAAWLPGKKENCRMQSVTKEGDA